MKKEINEMTTEHYSKHNNQDYVKHMRAVFLNLTQHEVSDRDIESREIPTKDGAKTLYYYQWAACWRELKRRFPDASYKFREFERDGKVYDVMYYPDTTASVHCSVTVAGITNDMWLPVMDKKNNSIPNPSSREISDAKMRCLVKCIAMHGLGLDINEGNYRPIKLGDPRAKTITLGEAKEKGLLP